MQKPNHKSRSTGPFFGRSFTQQNDGTDECPVATELPTVTGNATTPTLPVSEPSETKSKPDPKRVLSEGDYRRLPAFTIRSVSCCGLMEVSGIQPNMLSDNFRNVICGLQKTFITTMTQYRSLQKQHREAEEKFYNTNPRNSESPEAFRYSISQQSVVTHQLSYKHGLAGQFIFTYIVHSQHPDEWFEKFGEYVSKHSLGEIWISPKPFYNPNSHHHVRTVLFSVNNAGWWEFVKANMTEQQYDYNNV